MLSSIGKTALLDHVTKPARGVFVLRESQVAEPTAKTALRAEDFYAGRVFVRGRWESGLAALGPRHGHLCLVLTHGNETKRPVALSAAKSCPVREANRG